MARPLRIEYLGANFMWSTGETTREKYLK